MFPKHEHGDMLSLTFSPDLTESGEIEDLLWNLIPSSIFLGCFPRDMIPVTEIIEKPFTMTIINSDKSTKPGSHFVCLIRHGDAVMYFDSLALPEVYDLLEEDIEEIIEKTKANKVYINTKQIQGLRSNTCGYFCIYFVTFYYWQHPEFKDIKRIMFDPFSRVYDSIQNERLLARRIKMGIQQIIYRESRSRADPMILSEHLLNKVKQIEAEETANKVVEKNQSNALSS